MTFVGSRSAIVLKALTLASSRIAAGGVGDGVCAGAAACVAGAGAGAL